jgi:hypothetical protein
MALAHFCTSPFTSAYVDQVLNAAFGLRSPNPKVNGSEPGFDVAIEGPAVRLAHKLSGHVFEYLWFQRPPYLRNAIVHPLAACAVAPTQVAPIAAKVALLQLRSARLLAA